MALRRWQNGVSDAISRIAKHLLGHETANRKTTLQLGVIIEADLSLLRI